MFKNEILLKGVDVKESKYNNTFLRCLIGCPASLRCKGFWNNHFQNIKWNLFEFIITHSVTIIKLKKYTLKSYTWFTPQTSEMLSWFVWILCFFCGTDIGNVLHLFFECMYVQFFWNVVEIACFMLSGLEVHLS